MADFQVREAVVEYRTRNRGSKIKASDCFQVGLLGQEMLGTRTSEHFLVFAVSTRHEIVSYFLASKGAVEACPVDITEVMRFIILSGARKCIFMHNHPSGDVSPSEDDLKLTAQLIKACQVFGIKVMDHIIVAEERHLSMMESGDLATCELVAKV